MQIGDVDKRGFILVLGGRVADIYLTPKMRYLLFNPITKGSLKDIASSQEIIDAYNEVNGTNLTTKYVDAFWILAKDKIEETPITTLNEYEVIAKVPSNTYPDIAYEIRKYGSGAMTCECEGFGYRSICSHIKPYLKQRG